MSKIVGKDLFGKDLMIGDKVAYTTYGDETIRVGKIERETAKTIYISHESKWYSGRVAKSNRNSSRIIKL